MTPTFDYIAFIYLMHFFFYIKQVTIVLCKMLRGCEQFQIILTRIKYLLCFCFRGFIGEDRGIFSF